MIQLWKTYKGQSHMNINRLCYNTESTWNPNWRKCFKWLLKW